MAEWVVTLLGDADADPTPSNFPTTATAKSFFHCVYSGKNMVTASLMFPCISSLLLGWVGLWVVVVIPKLKWRMPRLKNGHTRLSSRLTLLFCQ